MIRHYIFDKEINGQVCHCTKSVMVGCENDAIKIIKRAAGSHLNEEFLKLAAMPKTIQRTVVCNPSDEFNAALGLRMADDRLLEAYNRMRDLAVNRYIDACAKQFNAVKDLVLTDVCLRAEKANGTWYDDIATMLMKEKEQK